MSRELRERLLLPVAVPVGSALLIAVLVFAFSRVLLAAPGEIAVAVALMMALNILVACGLVAAWTGGRRPNMVLLLGVVFVPAVIGLAATGIESEKGEVEKAAEPQRIEIGALNISFDKGQLTIEAGRKSVIEFNNREAVSHNVAIFAGADASGKKVFTGEIFSGPEIVEYQVPAIEPGSYFFRCDVHPTQMTGTIVAEKRAEKAEQPAASAPARRSVSADKLTFGTSELSFPSGAPVSLEFDNREAQPHNVAIFRGTDEKGERVFTGDVVTGPRKITYAISALPAGRYFFRCDIHPTTMRGSIEVT